MKYYYTAQEVEVDGETRVEIQRFNSTEERGIHLWIVNTRLAREDYPTPAAIKAEHLERLMPEAAAIDNFPAHFAYRDGKWTILSNPAAEVK